MKKFWTVVHIQNPEQRWYRIIETNINSYQDALTSAKNYLNDVLTNDHIIIMQAVAAVKRPKESDFDPENLPIKYV